MTATVTAFGPFHVNWISWAPTLGDGIVKTLEFTACSFAGAIVAGLLLALMRESPVAPVRWLARIYTEIFKNLPLITEIFLVYFGLASIGIKLSVFEAGCASLVVFYAAYLSEIFRGGLQSIAAGQREAAHALGLTEREVLARVVVPQAVRVVMPATTTMLVDMLKSTSLLITISAAELMTVGQLIASTTFRALEVYFVIGAIYFAMCYPLSMASLWLERKVKAGTPLSPVRRRLIGEVRLAMPAVTAGGQS
ncbi:MAG TPA: amino acid ABC transporter permease [Streptosporangiaceae bacterium]|nr:amino acid ABC transporter permease [Streptosporangiaceae bacterium]